jgi:ornithine cyclodeaminase/alanine dehydrogenase
MPDLLYLSRSDIERIDLPMTSIIQAVEDAFREKGEMRVEMPPKPGIHPRPDSFIHAMPAYVGGKYAAGVKWVSGFPANSLKNLPYISGLLILNDPETGLPLSVMDCTWITAKRTGAATAVAAKYLARRDSRSVGIIACGVQGRSNLEALSCLFTIETVKAFDIIPEVARQYALEMGKKLGLKVDPVGTCEEAVRDSDLVVTSGPILKEPKPHIEAGWLKKGAFACPLDFDSYWKGEAFAEIDRLATDDLSQLDYYRTIGYFTQTPKPYADLGEIVAGKKAGRLDDSERTMSLNLGLAIEDMVTAVLIYQSAKNRGIGTLLGL